MIPLTHCPGCYKSLSDKGGNEYYIAQLCSTVCPTNFFQTVKRSDPQQLICLMFYTEHFDCGFSVSSNEFHAYKLPKDVWGMPDLTLHNFEIDFSNLIKLDHHLQLRMIFA